MGERERAFVAALVRRRLHSFAYVQSCQKNFFLWNEEGKK